MDITKEQILALPWVQECIKKGLTAGVPFDEGDPSDCYYPESQRLFEIVGTYSQNCFACSFNDDDVFAMLVSGRMNEDVKRRVLVFYCQDVYDRNVADGLFPADGNHEKYLIDAILACGGWMGTPLDQYIRLTRSFHYDSPSYD